jgi:hypothetical protein
MFYSDTFPQIIQFLLLSGFTIGHPGQRRVVLLVNDNNQRADRFTDVTN